MGWSLGFAAGLGVGVAVAAVMARAPRGSFGYRMWNRMQSRGGQHFPTRIVLMRHGQSEGNTNKALFASVPDWKQSLTGKGRQQACESGKALRSIVGNDRVAFFVSPYRRTRQTCQQVIRHFDREKVSIAEEPRLREQEWGMFQNPKAIERIKGERQRVGTFYYRFPRGESGADVYDRVTTFLDTLHRCYTKRPTHYDTVVLITHGILARLFLMRWFHWSVDTFESVYNLENAQLVVMERTGNKYKLKTALTTSNPDSIRPFCADGVEPVYCPPNSPTYGSPVSPTPARPTPPEEDGPGPAGKSRMQTSGAGKGKGKGKGKPPLQPPASPVTNTAEDDHFVADVPPTSAKPSGPAGAGAGAGAAAAAAAEQSPDK